MAARGFGFGIPFTPGTQHISEVQYSALSFRLVPLSRFRFIDY
jgi:hypothetical protein